MTDSDRDIIIAENENATNIITTIGFDKGLKNKGVLDGCCSLSATYCYPEYPQNKNGNRKK